MKKSDGASARERRCPCCGLAVMGETKAKILRICGEGATWADMMEDLGIAKATLCQHLNELQSKGYITKKGGKYALSQKGGRYLAKVGKCAEGA